MNVKFAKIFEIQLNQFDEVMQKAIFDFATHVKEKGLTGLKGRNKSSAIPNTTKKGTARYKHAQKHCLWHYHIGLPCYIGEFGDMTSDFILHYMRFDDCVVLVDITSHPPFELPSDDKLSY